jgi:hypothetical protein
MGGGAWRAGKTMVDCNRRNLAMRVLVMMTALLCASAARADAVDNVVKKAGEAMALADLCPALKLDDNRIAMVLLLSGVALDDIEPGKRRFNQMAGAMAIARAGLKKSSQAAICFTGTYLYGPQGLNAPGFLVEE